MPPICNPLHSELRSLQDGATPLHIAAENGQLEMVRLLLSEGSNKETAKKVGAMWLTL